MCFDTDYSIVSFKPYIYFGAVLFRTLDSPYDMTAGGFKKVREVQVSLDLKASGSYTCRIALIGVDIHNSKIIRHLDVPHDKPLDFWRESYIHLDLI